MAAKKRKDRREEVGLIVGCAGEGRLFCGSRNDNKIVTRLYFFFHPFLSPQTLRRPSAPRLPPRLPLPVCVHPFVLLVRPFTLPELIHRWIVPPGERDSLFRWRSLQKSPYGTSFPRPKPALHCRIIATPLNGNPPRRKSSLPPRAAKTRHRPTTH